MSGRTEFFHTGIQTRPFGIVSMLSGGSWTWIGLGAVALAFYLFLAATSQSEWPVLVGPFVLVGSARLMGLRSLWPESSGERSLRESPSLGLVEKASLHADAVHPEDGSELASLEIEIAAQEPQPAIDELTRNAGKTGRRRARNAYMIGRQYMRLEQFEEAREWLLQVASQGKKHSALRNAADRYLSACNVELLAQGDAFYASGDLHRARERYARLSQGIPEGEGRSLAVFLRTACVYCDLQDYEAAGQAVLQALNSGEHADKALGLRKILQALAESEEGMSTSNSRDRVEAALADHVSRLMDGLCATPQESVNAPSA